MITMYYMLFSTQYMSLVSLQWLWYTTTHTMLLVFITRELC